MLDEILYLTPDAAIGPAEGAAEKCTLEPTDPPIMIPGIDENDAFYPVEKITAHIEGLHHQALSVFVFSGDELLIQRRADEKYHCGGLWANTCCTHPHFGEDADTAAHRRMQEELGFVVPLHQKLIVEYSADVGGGLWERERVHMYRADIDKSAVSIVPNPSEVSETLWVGAEELHKDINANPLRYTPWFRIYLKHYPELNF